MIELRNFWNWGTVQTRLEKNSQEVPRKELPQQWYGTGIGYQE